MHMQIDTVMSYSSLKFRLIFQKMHACRVFCWFIMVLLSMIKTNLSETFRHFVCLGVTEYTCEDNVNPCGDDAYCNQTKTSLLCQCKPGFQRNERNRQCEGTDLFYQLSLLEKEMCITCIFFLEYKLFHSNGIQKLR